MKNAKELDKLDKNIIRLLKTDGRTSNREIAEKLSVSEGTVRNRISHLLESDELKICGLIDPDIHSGRQLVLLAINVAASKDLVRIARNVAKLPGVQAVSIITGRYDLMVEVWTDAKLGLIEFIDGPLASVEGIVATESFVIMKNFNKWIATDDL